MTTHHTRTTSTGRRALACALSAGLIASIGSATLAKRGTCTLTAEFQRRAASFELKEDLKERMAVCLNLTDPDERRECVEEAFDEYAENRALAQEQYHARRDLCELLGEDPYDPEIDPAGFADEIDNPYFPLPVGARWTYEGESDEGTEVIEVEVLDETREILGVECVTVRDVVFLEGEVIEDTLDWFAQDLDGNVWYFGEISFNYEDGYVADIDGSWLAGEDGAKPGIVMLANPIPGTTYRQEWLLGEAEDAATVLADDASVDLGIGLFEDCVQTADFLPPEPDELEHKFFAPGIGFIYETKPGTPESVALVDYTIP